MPRIPLAPVALITAALLAVAGCGTTDRPGGDRDGTTVTGTVTVFAAASLTSAFTTIGTQFEAAHPGVVVRFNFAGSSGLATQITEGAPADVFAAADPATMARVTEAGAAEGPPTTFVRNQLVVAVAPGNPKRITGLADLTRPDVQVALCAEQVPCGAAARRALAAADVDVEVTAVTLERDVKGALAKVTLGEVDAALVYRTDVRAAEKVDGVEFPESGAAINDYPIVGLADAPNPTGAREFVAYVLSEPGRTVLTRAGFQTP
ncbi:molybdate ABC transporter substrate-binding protein [Micromonospora sp. SH-82]|uniref:molybdate ABC transporter substrate-binding protein n=1 Tax=Micromonospora sp. SH-82 TaxID=3132938 RepID=UPI003EBB55AE